MSTFKPIDARRDDFRKYLERTGILEAISKVFVKLIHSNERPENAENAIEFVCENLGHTLHTRDKIEVLERELEDSKNEITQLKRIIETMKLGDKNIPADLLAIAADQFADDVDDNNIPNTENIPNVTEIEKQMKGLKIENDKKIQEDIKNQQTDISSNVNKEIDVLVNNKTQQKSETNIQNEEEVSNKLETIKDVN